LDAFAHISRQLALYHPAQPLEFPIQLSKSKRLASQSAEK